MKTQRGYTEVIMFGVLALICGATLLMALAQEKQWSAYAKNHCEPIALSDRFSHEHASESATEAWRCDDGRTYIK